MVRAQVLMAVFTLGKSLRERVIWNWKCFGAGFGPENAFI